MAESKTTRRGFLTGAAVAVAAGAGGWLLRGGGETTELAPSSTPDADVMQAADQRPGITYPVVPQRRLQLLVFSFPGMSSADLLEAVTAASYGAAPADAGEVTVTVGYGPTHALQLWPERASRSTELPAFAGDTADMHATGDLAVQVCAETASGARDAADAFAASVGGQIVWQQSGYRDAGTPEGTARTSTGFIDGIINPRTPELLNNGVWVDSSHRDTFLVVRRMYVAPSFTASPVAEQERAIGRVRDSGVPLSGGGVHNEVDLFSKTADGKLLTPPAAHARRAHPTNIGRPLMLRRSYSFDPNEGAGLVFVAYMNDPQTFVMTQRRLDEMDDLIAATRTDASGCFFIPGS